MPSKDHRSSRNDRERDYEREKDYDRDRDHDRDRERDKDRDRTSRKRKEDKDEDEEYSKRKTKRFEEAPTAPIAAAASSADDSFAASAPVLLNAEKIKEMMANAKKMISKRKEELHIPDPSPVTPSALMSDAMEKAKQAADIKARIQASFASLGAGGVVFPMPPVGVLPSLAPAAPTMPAAMPLVSAGPKTGSGAPSKPAPLILDEQGRTIDASTGEVVEISRTYAPTLKANIRAKRREQFKTAIEKPPDEISDSKFFDARVALKAHTRSRRGFKFHDKGKFQVLASRLRTKAQLERLQNEIVQAAKKTGIASAAKLASIAPKKELSAGEVPEIEWWDSYIVKGNSYDAPESTADESAQPAVGASRYDGITCLVEHPQQLKPPGESSMPIVIPIMLTKAERKKLRRQNRAEAQKELQEKIRLGLLPPPEPKVRMANLMRVLGTEAVQDPTKVEAHVRAQMAKRQKAHEEANAARKLTPNQKREKKIKKMTEDTTQGVNVAVFRVHDLKDPAKKFKVETNAKQLFLTGLVVMCKDCNCVVVEGGPKQLKKFKRLMLHRIKWDSDKKNTEEKDDDDSDTEELRPVSKKCFLIWEGIVTQRAFGDIRFKVCPTEAFAREQFKRASVEHYWNLAYSGAVLEAAGVELAPAASQAEAV